MPTIVKTAKHQGMPEGTYDVIFVNLKQGVETQFGEKQSWEFEVVAPAEFAGRKVQRLTGLETGNEKAMCTKYMQWVTGDTEGKDVEPFYGHQYQAMLGVNDKGYNVIERIFPAKKTSNSKAKAAPKDVSFSGIEVLDVMK